MTETTLDLSALQGRTLNVLRGASIPAQAAVSSVVAVGTLLAKDLLGGDRWAGLASAGWTLGAAITSVPLSASMRRRGRRPGLVVALLLGGCGTLVAAAGGQLRLFPIFLIGMLLIGCGQSAALQARYVGADLASEVDRAKAIGAVVWVGTLGAVIGPVFVPHEKRFGKSLGFDEYIGPFFFAGGFFLIASIVYLVFLKPDPLIVAGGTDPDAERVRPIQQLRRSYVEIRRSHTALLGLVAMAASQATMVGVMTMTPPHMKDHGQADLSAIVIAVHILGMFGLAPLTGRFVAAVGGVRAVQLGAVILGVGTVVTVVSGYVPAMIFLGLFLVGVGWNLGLIGGTTLLTSSVPLDTRVEAQGTGDLTLSFCGAVAAFGSGFVKQAAGFHILANMATGVAAGLLIFALLTQVRIGRLAASVQQV